MNRLFLFILFLSTVALMSSASPVGPLGWLKSSKPPAAPTPPASSSAIPGVTKYNVQQHFDYYYNRACGGNRTGSELRHQQSKLLHHLAGKLEELKYESAKEDWSDPEDQQAINDEMLKLTNTYYGIARAYNNEVRNSGEALALVPETYIPDGLTSSSGSRRRHRKGRKGSKSSSTSTTPYRPSLGPTPEDGSGSQNSEQEQEEEGEGEQEDEQHSRYHNERAIRREHGTRGESGYLPDGNSSFNPSTTSSFQENYYARLNSMRNHERNLEIFNSPEDTRGKAVQQEHDHDSEDESEERDYGYNPGYNQGTSSWPVEGEQAHVYGQEYGQPYGQTYNPYGQAYGQAYGQTYGQGYGQIQEQEQGQFYDPSTTYTYDYSSNKTSQEMAREAKEMARRRNRDKTVLGKTENMLKGLAINVSKKSKKLKEKLEDRVEEIAVTKKWGFGNMMKKREK